MHVSVGSMLPRSLRDSAVADPRSLIACGFDGSCMSTRLELQLVVFFCESF